MVHLEKEKQGKRQVKETDAPDVENSEEAIYDVPCSDAW